ncbi:MAG: hypothetical protein NTU44_15370 [Bacteroidetes bacterium]|nr:hypothetical protein [Bacteroidota bacterium]
MDIIEFHKVTSKQNIKERDKVTVSTSDITLTGTLVPCTVVIAYVGEIHSNILHEKNGELLISIKSHPDGFGPDIGKPVYVKDIIHITKVD